ncbi:hypothetical protein NM688_g5195 [Phlebia brevispora]|uniref:Uncharacterized protein n=1 Tax=Phlebia brevispora TaxID=194682 RepID=A0ACC1SZ82_9APHY|nr:hypothetical protein NM688_g5195 [Phlebia brevispora]
MAHAAGLRTLDINIDTPRTRDGTPLKMAARSYVPRDVSNVRSDGVTLLFAHGAGGHKELWEPIIIALYQCQAHCGHLQPIREVWSIDYQSHGDSAVLNDAIFRGQDIELSPKDWGAAIANFHRDHLAARRVVCIGHSVGGTALTNSLSFFTDTSSRPYEAMILIEPIIISRSVFQSHTEQWRKQGHRMSEGTRKRRDVWESRQAALAHLSQRYPWNLWDESVLQIFVDHGLCPVHGGRGRVTLKCAKAHEASNYTEEEACFLGMEQVERACGLIPVHTVFGEAQDLLPEFVRKCLSDVTDKHSMSPTTIIPGAGHFVPQEKPLAVAEHIWRILLQLDDLEGRHMNVDGDLRARGPSAAKSRL